MLIQVPALQEISYIFNNKIKQRLKKENQRSVGLAAKGNVSLFLSTIRMVQFQN